VLSNCITAAQSSVEEDTSAKEEVGCATIANFWLLRGTVRCSLCFQELDPSALAATGKTSVGSSAPNATEQAPSSRDSVEEDATSLLEPRDVSAREAQKLQLRVSGINCYHALRAPVARTSGNFLGFRFSLDTNDPDMLAKGFLALSKSLQRTFVAHDHCVPSCVVSFDAVSLVVLSERRNRYVRKEYFVRHLTSPTSGSRSVGIVR
jgi:hypothetical protein